MSKNIYKDIVEDDEFSLDLDKIPTKRKSSRRKSVGKTTAKKKRSFVSSTLDDAPTTSDDVPSTSDYVPSTSDDIPSTLDDVLSTSDDAPSHSSRSGFTRSEVRIDFEESLDAYIHSILLCNGVVCLDVSSGVFAMVGWDEKANALKKTSVVMIHKTHHGFICTCTPEANEFLNRVPSCSSQDYHSLFRECIHLQAFNKVVDCFLNVNDINSFTMGQDDHNYDSSLEDTNALVFPLEWVLLNTFGVIKDQTYSVVGRLGSKMACLTCPNPCKHESLLCAEDRNLDQQPSYNIPLHSHKSIPFNIDNARLISKPQDVFIQEEGLLHAIPSLSDCTNCGATLHEECHPLPHLSKLVNKYCQFDVQCFSRNCSTCETTFHFDGQDECVLHVGKFLVHYEVLRDYMFHYLLNGTTLSTYFKIWSLHQKDNGVGLDTGGFAYAHFRLAWFRYLSLLDIDYNQGFICNICLTKPSILIFDGTALGFQKTFLPDVNILHGTEDPHRGRYSDRVFVNDKPARQQLAMFAKDGLSKEVFERLLDVLTERQPSLIDLLRSFLLEDETSVTCPPKYKDFLKSLAAPSSVCATFPFKYLNLLYQLINLGESMIPVELLKELQDKIPVLFRLLAEEEVLNACLIKILKAVVSLVEDLFSGLCCFGMTRYSTISSYPALPLQRQRGFYSADKLRKDPVCQKKGSRHPTLVPGIFTVLCRHGICYGFEVMTSMESPNNPFTFMKTRLQEPPPVVIYDNACNLQEYCLNRDPVYFRNTQFLVDRLHWFNHKSCSIGYEARSYPWMANVNTQIVEQCNSKLKKLKSGLSYMKKDNFMDMLRFFLWRSNHSVKDKLGV